MKGAIIFSLINLLLSSHERSGTHAPLPMKHLCLASQVCYHGGYPGFTLPRLEVQHLHAKNRSTRCFTPPFWMRQSGDLQEKLDLQMVHGTHDNLEKNIMNLFQLVQPCFNNVRVFASIFMSVSILNSP